MAMERFLTALIFCEAPLDGYGTSVMAPGAIAKLVSGGSSARPATANLADAEKKQEFFYGKPAAQRRAGPWFDLAFDGINCFDTVVMH